MGRKRRCGQRDRRRRRTGREDDMKTGQGRCFDIVADSLKPQDFKPVPGGTMRANYLSLIAVTAFALPSLGCQNDATGPFAGGPPSLSAATSTENVESVINLTRFVPCANGGQGEDVFLSGAFHGLFHVTLDGSGGAHVVVVHNPQGITGTGLITGAKYQGVGASPQDISNVKVGEEHTSVVNMRIIGQGPGNNLTLHENVHTTVLADGTVTSFHDNFIVECR
jgi:hypothetical protein